MMTDSKETPVQATGGIEELLRGARRAQDAGDSFEARAAYRRVTELDPGQVDAWLGLGAASPKYAEKAEYFRRGLALDPGNAEAAAGLAEAEQQIAAGNILVPRSTPPRPVAEVVPLPLPEAAAAHCYVHPQREAYVRCFQCNRPICSSCVTPTPVGQICPECRKARRSANYKVSWRDLAVAFVVALAVSALVGFGVGLVRAFTGFFFYIVLFLTGSAIGELIVRAVERTTKMKRGREMQVAVSIAIVLGAAVAFFFTGALLAIILFAALAVSTAVARLR